MAIQISAFFEPIPPPEVPVMVWRGRCPPRYHHRVTPASLARLAWLVAFTPGARVSPWTNGLMGWQATIELER